MKLETAGILFLAFAIAGIFCVVAYDDYGMPVHTQTVTVQDKGQEGGYWPILGCDGTEYWTTNWVIDAELQPGHTYSLQVRNHFFVSMGKPSIESINNALPSAACAGQNS